MGFLTKLWDAVVKILEKIWDILKVVIAIALLIACIYFVFIGAYVYAALCFVAAYLVDEDTAMKFVSAVSDAAAAAAGAAADIASSVLGAVASTFFSSPIGIGLLALGGWYLISSLSDDKKAQTDSKQVGETDSQVDERIQLRLKEAGYGT